MFDIVRGEVADFHCHMGGLKGSVDSISTTIQFSCIKKTLSLVALAHLKHISPLSIPPSSLIRISTIHLFLSFLSRIFERKNQHNAFRSSSCPGPLGLAAPLTSNAAVFPSITTSRRGSSIPGKPKPLPFAPRFFQIPARPQCFGS